MALDVRNTDTPGSCGSCNVFSCSYNAQKQLLAISMDQTAWLLDEYFPEFDMRQLQNYSCSDLFLAPWHRPLLAKKTYDWKLPKGAIALTHLSSLAYRSYGMRKKSGGGQRQKTIEKYDRHFAERYSRRLPYNIRHLRVWQNFVPFLFMNKALGGGEPMTYWHGGRPGMFSMKYLIMNGSCGRKVKRCLIFAALMKWLKLKDWRLIGPTEFIRPIRNLLNYTRRKLNFCHGKNPSKKYGKEGERLYFWAQFWVETGHTLYARP
jgi:hypothetical protein